mmetsp:Transcript_2517/g.6783  ORF Transcript_2517/g.6783 Transcript_2517/m.6783 type:complete len:252 (-) Transcript_2517:52-807(-)
MVAAVLAEHAQELRALELGRVGGADGRHGGTGVGAGEAHVAGEDGPQPAAERAEAKEAQGRVCERIPHRGLPRQECPRPAGLGREGGEAPRIAAAMALLPAEHVGLLERPRNGAGGDGGQAHRGSPDECGEHGRRARDAQHGRRGHLAPLQHSRVDGKRRRAARDEGQRALPRLPRRNGHGIRHRFHQSPRTPLQRRVRPLFERARFLLLLPGALPTGLSVAVLRPPPTHASIGKKPPSAGAPQKSNPKSE